MPSSKAYRDYILEQLSGLEEITCRAMMGEYILYYRGRVAGGIYDDRLLVKPVRAAAAYMPTAALEPPYPGAKGMLAVENVDDRDYLCGLFEAMFDQLAEPKARRR